MAENKRKRPRQSFATVVSNNWFALKKVAHYTPGLFVLMFVEIFLIELLAAGGAYSDALSTALLVMGREKAAALAESLQVEAIFITADGTLTHTAGLNGIFERN